MFSQYRVCNIKNLIISTIGPLVPHKQGAMPVSLNLDSVLMQLFRSKQAANNTHKPLPTGGILQKCYNIFKVQFFNYK